MPYIIYFQQQQIALQQFQMLEEADSLMNLFNNPDSSSNKKTLYKKQSYLLKFQLFTLIFQKKGEQNFNQIVNKIKIRQYGCAEDVFRDFKQRNFVYIISGLMLIFVTKIDDQISAPFLYKRIGPNQYFGQKIIFNNNLKLHSAKSASKTYAFELDLQTLYKTFSGHFKYQQLKQKVEFLSKIWLFKQTSTSQIQRILLLSKPFRYCKNTIIFKQGQQPEAAYVIIQGEVACFSRDNTSTNQNNHKISPFMVLVKGQVCCSEELLQRKLMEAGGIVISSYAVLLKIEKQLFMDIFQQKIANHIIQQRNQVKEKLIEVKSKKSIKQSLRRLNQSKRTFAEPENKIRRKRLRYKTEQRQVKIQNIFNINEGNISWQNKLKDRQLREVVLKQKWRDEKLRATSIRLSTVTNNSFTNEKQLLLDYLIKKQKRNRKAEEWEENFRKEAIHPVRQLLVQRSNAVKNQKRKLKTSRQKNSASVPTLV